MDPLEGTVVARSKGDPCEIGLPRPRSVDGRPLDPEEVSREVPRNQREEDGALSGGEGTTEVVGVARD